MFDPERDEEPDRRHYYLRLLVVMVISVAGCIALWPSVSGFSAGPGHDTRCLAVTDGWHTEQAVPDPTSTAHDPGTCVGPSRHRLILSGIGLASIAAIAGGIALVIRTRKDPAPKRRVDPELVNV